MKKLLFLLILTLPAFIFAQNKEGKISYTEEVKFQIDLPEGMEHLKDKLPSSQKEEKELLFNNSSSLWRTAVVEEDEAAATLEDTEEQSNFRFKMIRSGAESELFKDLDKDLKVEKTDFMGKVFLIEDALKKYPWKLTGEKKSIAGYDCEEAIFQEEEQKIIAWFSPQIPVSSGPEDFGALPGMILEIDIDDGQRMISATKVEWMSLEEGAINPPKKGKKISQEAYDDIVEAKTKEMQEEMGGNTMQIRIGQ